MHSPPPSYTCTVGGNPVCPGETTLGVGLHQPSLEGKDIISQDVVDNITTILATFDKPMEPSSS